MVGTVPNYKLIPYQHSERFLLIGFTNSNLDNNLKVKRSITKSSRSTISGFLLCKTEHLNVRIWIYYLLYMIYSYFIIYYGTVNAPYWRMCFTNNQNDVSKPVRWERYLLSLLLEPSLNSCLHPPSVTRVKAQGTVVAKIQHNFSIINAIQINTNLSFTNFKQNNNVGFPSLEAYLSHA